LGSRGRFRYVDARDSTGMERRLDLAEPRRKAAGDRRRCGRTAAEVRRTFVDDELAGQVNELLALPGGRRLFR